MSQPFQENRERASALQQTIDAHFQATGQAVDRVNISQVVGATITIEGAFPTGGGRTFLRSEDGITVDYEAAKVYFNAVELENTARELAKACEKVDSRFVAVRY
ncbi:hypothetical protein EXS73_01795 [Candidatus Pacearchaeota archaeon]|nr:hypothetical protein [Candidatus Pacearchaeota archaeon]